MTIKPNLSPVAVMGWGKHPTTNMTMREKMMSAAYAAFISGSPRGEEDRLRDALAAALDALMEPTEAMMWDGIVPYEVLQEATKVSDDAYDTAVSSLVAKTGRNEIASFYIFTAMIRAAKDGK